MIDQIDYLFGRVPDFVFVIGALLAECVLARILIAQAAAGNFVHRID